MGGKKPYLALILIQSIYVGMFLLSKAAFNGGMKSCVFIFYRQVAGTVIVVPLALIFERKNAPPLSFVTFCKIFMLSLIGVETMKLRTILGIAKVASLIACMAGVATLALYKGPHLKPLFHHRLFRYQNSQQDHQVHVSYGEKWIMGCFLAFFSTTTWGSSFEKLPVEAHLHKPSMPFKHDSVICRCHCFRKKSLSMEARLEYKTPCGSLLWNSGAGVTFYVQAWVIEKKGPVFQAMSTPLALVMTIFCSTFLLGEIISLGRWDLVGRKPLQCFVGEEQRT